MLTAIVTAYWKTKTIDIGMAGNGAIGALVAITAPSGYVELWAAPIIGAVAGVIVAARRSTRSTRRSTTRSARSPRTASRASGARSPAASSPRRGWRSTTRSATPTAASSTRARSAQLGYQALGSWSCFAFVFTLSLRTFWAIKKTYGLRVTEEEEEAGLDISEHGMYGYPEQFIPAPELVGFAAAAGSREHPRRRRPPPKEVPAS